jgi:hypothetical protein
MSKFIAAHDQAADENRVLLEMPAAERPGAVGSIRSDKEAQYAENKRLNKIMFQHELDAFMRVDRATGAGVNEIGPYFEKMLDSVQVSYKHVQLQIIPDSAFELCKLLDPPFSACPSVFLALVNDNMPMHAEPIEERTLRQIGWRPVLGLYWWKYRRDSTKLTENAIYKVRMTGEIEGIGFRGT